MTPAERQRCHRARLKKGKRVVRVEVDEVQVADALGLGPLNGDNPEVLRKAIERHLAGLTMIEIEELR